jgi:hypothetical protein
MFSFMSDIHVCNVLCIVQWCKAVAPHTDPLEKFIWPTHAVITAPLECKILNSPHRRLN